MGPRAVQHRLNPCEASRILLDRRALIFPCGTFWLQSGAPDHPFRAAVQPGVRAIATAYGYFAFPKRASFMPGAG